MPRLNRRATNAKYIRRMATKPRRFFAPLEGKFLSCYEVGWTTVTPDTIMDGVLELDCPAIHLMRFLQQKHGIRVLGVVSEHTSDGVYHCAEREGHEAVFVGPRSAWGKREQDNVYYKKGDDTSLDTFHVII